MIPPKKTEGDKVNIYIRSLPRRKNETDLKALQKLVMRQVFVSMVVAFNLGALLRTDFSFPVFILVFLFGISLLVFAYLFLHRTISLFSAFDMNSENLPVPDNEELPTRLQIAISKRVKY